MSECIPHLLVKGPTPISLNDVVQLCAKKPELVWRATSEVRPEHCAEYSELLPEGYAEWTGHSSGQGVLYAFGSGQLSATVIDDESIAQAERIAHTLHAKVDHRRCDSENEEFPGPGLVVLVFLFVGGALSFYLWRRFFASARS